MKNLIILISFALLLIGCSRNNETETDNTPKLPPETQTGANTFGCMVNGRLFYPRDGVGDVMGTAKAINFYASSSSTYQYNEMSVANLRDGKPINYLYFHLHDLPTKGVGEYIWKDSNFNSGIDGLMQDYLYIRAFDYNSNTWKWYTSYENSGKTTITKNDKVNFIVSGTFSGKLRTADGLETIEIKEGRFDLNKKTLQTTNFP
jgi:hypothetical protein